MKRRHFLQTSGLALGSMHLSAGLFKLNRIGDDTSGHEWARTRKMAAQELPVGEPLDWMENAFPKKWNLNGKTEEFNWDI